MDESYIIVSVMAYNIQTYKILGLQVEHFFKNIQTKY